MNSPTIPPQHLSTAARRRAGAPGRLLLRLAGDLTSGRGLPES
jgi:hypothetical protein